MAEKQGSSGYAVYDEDVVGCWGKFGDEEGEKPDMKMIESKRMARATIQCNAPREPATFSPSCYRARRLSYSSGLVL